MRFYRYLLAVGAWAVLLCLLPLGLYAQSATTGMVQGTVVDPTGAVVPGATVALTNKTTNVTVTTTTDATGRYLFPAVNPGDYSLKVTSTGFQTFMVANLTVTVTKTYTIPVKLKIGTASQTVTVKEVAGAELQTTNASIGTTIGGNTLQFLPTEQRNVASLLSLQPAVAPELNGVGANSPSDVMGGQVAGAASDQTTFLVDGGDATNDLEGTGGYEGIPGQPQPAPAISVNVESTQEFRVVDAGPTASLNRSQGGQISIVSKHGTNQFHGSVYEYYTGDALGANSWTNNTYGIPKPHTVNNRFGFTFGGPLLKNKLFFFGNYEGRRFRQSASISTDVPSAMARQGILQFRDAAQNVIPYYLQSGNISNLCGPSGNLPCDPRGIGIDPLIQQYWSNEPLPNQPGTGDGLNSIGYVHSYAEPDNENYGLLRLDYSINSRWHLFGTYREQKILFYTPSQVDIIPGQQQLISATPVQPHFATFMLTGQIGSHFTMQTHGSYMRDWWAWNRATLANPANVPGIGGTLQVSGEGATGTGGSGKPFADPINFNTQQARARTWDGRDWYLAEDDSWLHGNHTFQFGAAWYYWNITHIRTDDVLGGLTGGPIYWVSSSNASSGSYAGVGANYMPPTCTTTLTTNCLQSSDTSRWASEYAAMLGMVDHTSQVATRNGLFQANPLGTPLADNVHIGSFYTYWQDVWQVKPTVTITYGLSWGLQFPPEELNGLQSVAEYSANGQPISNINAYFQARQQAMDSMNFAALQGLNNFQYAPIRTVPGVSRPLSTYYGALGPRFAVAWQPSFDNPFFGNRQTVIRAGYSIVWNRTNAVGLVMTPLLGTGPTQIVGCNAPAVTGGIGGPGTFAGCTGSNTNPTNAFRIGIDGNSLPMPTPTSGYPVSVSSPLGSTYGFNMDPAWTPPYSHNVTFDIQRSFPNNWLVDLGYIGRFSRNLENGADLGASDMFAKDPISGQTLAQAFDNISQFERAGGTAANAPTQPFFEDMMAPENINGTMMGGTALCEYLYSSTCTVAATETADSVDPGATTNGSLGGFMELGYNLIASVPLDPMQYLFNFWNYGGGYANYNAGFISVHKAFSQGLNFTFNYTWSHALGTQALNQEYIIYGNPSPYQQSTGYGTAAFDRRNVFNSTWYYVLPFGHGQRFASSNSFINRIIGGWYSSGIWTWQSGLPICIAADGDYGDLGSGAVNQTCAQAPSQLFGLAGQYRNVPGSGGIGVAGAPANGGSGINILSDPAAVYNSLSRPLLTQNLRPFDFNFVQPPTWNVDLSFGKNIIATERYKAYFTADLFNAFNLFQPDWGNVSLDMNNPAAFGVVTDQGNQPRSIQLGLRFEF